eukprot:4041935-Pyramimonas_sp.AAC.1
MLDNDLSPHRPVELVFHTRLAMLQGFCFRRPPPLPCTSVFGPAPKDSCWEGEKTPADAALNRVTAGDFWGAF